MSLSTPTKSQRAFWRIKNKNKQILEKSKIVQNNNKNIIVFSQSTSFSRFQDLQILKEKEEQVKQNKRKYTQIRKYFFIGVFIFLDEQVVVCFSSCFGR